MNTIKLNTIGTPCKAEGGGNSGGGTAPSAADEWIVAIANEDNPNVNMNIAMLVVGICNLNGFQKGDCLQIVRDSSGNKFVSVITPLEDLSDAFKSYIMVGGAIRIGATMNDIGDGKVRTFNNKEDYKNILLELSLMSGYDVTIADVESAVIFLSQNELMSMMSNYGG